MQRKSRPQQKPAQTPTKRSTSGQKGPCTHTQSTLKLLLNKVASFVARQHTACTVPPPQKNAVWTPPLLPRHKLQALSCQAAQVRACTDTSLPMCVPPLAAPALAHSCMVSTALPGCLGTLLNSNPLLLRTANRVVCTSSNRVRSAAARAASQELQQPHQQTTFHHGITYVTYEGNSFWVKFNNSGLSVSQSVSQQLS